MYYRASSILYRSDVGLQPRELERFRKSSFASVTILFWGKTDDKKWVLKEF